jgi:hypothetical protein
MRAPITGYLGEVATQQPSAVVRQGDTLGVMLHLVATLEASPSRPRRHLRRLLRADGLLTPTTERGVAPWHRSGIEIAPTHAETVVLWPADATRASAAGGGPCIQTWA